MNRRLTIGLAAALLLAIWIGFFDSHSLQKRIVWASELEALEEENVQLRARIQELEASLEAGVTDEDIARIARENFGMQRPGETVYRVEEEVER